MADDISNIIEDLKKIKAPQEVIDLYTIERCDVYSLHRTALGILRDDYSDAENSPLLAHQAKQLEQLKDVIKYLEGKV